MAVTVSMYTGEMTIAGPVIEILQFSLDSGKVIFILLINSQIPK